MKSVIRCMVALTLLSVVTSQLQTPNYRNMQGNVDLTRMMMAAQPKQAFQVPAVPPASLPSYRPQPAGMPALAPWNNFWDMVLLDNLFGGGFFFE